LRKYLMLTRIQSGAATAIAPVAAALASEPYGCQLPSLAVLFVMGLLVHIFGFALNEYMDLRVDRLAGELSTKPLVSGDIPPHHALYIAITAVFSAVILSVIFFPGPLVYLFILATSLGGAYDLYSKRMVGSDLLLGTWIFVFCIYGSLAVTGKVSALALVVALLFFVQLVFQTAVTGGLKDVEHDLAGGARTPPIWLGVRVENGEIRMTPAFRSYSIAWKLANIVLALLPFVVLGSRYNLVQIALLLFAGMQAMRLTIQALQGGVFDRKKKMNLLLRQEIFSYILIPVMLFTTVGFRTFLTILLLPILWLAFWILAIYGKRLPNV